jgi:pyruvate/2-oxoglutarate dehydrogenase complex dihydrolipoamide acyltransferase (E2) component
VIAILLEEGDSIDSIVLPSSSPVAPSLAPSAVPAATPPPIAATPSPTPATIAASASVEVFHPQSTKPLSPAVARLLAINKIENANQITASGKHGMLTKGDVLRFLNGTNISAVDTSVVETSPIETVEIVSGAAGAVSIWLPHRLSGVL